MKIKQIIFITTAAVSFAACSATPSSTIKPTAAKVSNTAVNQSVAETTHLETTSQVDTESSANSPTESLKTFIQALNNQDVEVLKNTLSKKSLTMIAASAKAQKKSLDEVLKKGDGSFLKDAVEFKNEKIKGEIASVEAKDPAGANWLTMPMVKEEGAWKMAFDKILDDLDAPQEEGLTTTSTKELGSAELEDLSNSRPKSRSSTGMTKIIRITQLSNGSLTKSETARRHH
ncbi:MAG: hypothetical protein ABI954_11175 [Pyrinomonadaceae bacterium]